MPNTEADLAVAAGVIRNIQGQVLLAQRHEQVHQGGKWEFPGGKLKPGESALAGLGRELDEELGIKVQEARFLICVRHRYPELRVTLWVFEVIRFTGVPHGRENQPLAWVGPSELDRYDLPAADRPIVGALTLPAFYPVLEGKGEEEGYRAQFYRLLEQGHRLLYLRARDLPTAAYLSLVEEFGYALKTAGGCLMIRPIDGAQGPGQALGLHLTHSQLHNLSFRPYGWQRVAAACHSLYDLKQAERLGIDFAVLSPVQATLTHPEASPLGWEVVAHWLEKISLPTYLMGGLARCDLDRARRLGAQGLAGIRLFGG
ncbi:MAG: Nudix family hydrolase [Methylohalobius sp.]|nr:Nudix family hydrolase [Methylohalobius sp.]